MWSYIEFNDTLQITSEQWFPSEMRLEKHLVQPFTIKDFEGKIFAFHGKEGKRIFHSPPTRVFLVHNIADRWLYWWHCLVVEQSIDGLKNETSGKFIITKVYSPEYQKQISMWEVDEGKGYFRDIKI